MLQEFDQNLVCYYDLTRSTEFCLHSSSVTRARTLALEPDITMKSAENISSQKSEIFKEKKSYSG